MKESKLNIKKGPSRQVSRIITEEYKDIDSKSKKSPVRNIN